MAHYWPCVGRLLKIVLLTKMTASVLSENPQKTTLGNIIIEPQRPQREEEEVEIDGWDKKTSDNNTRDHCSLSISFLQSTFNHDPSCSLTFTKWLLL